MREGFYFNAKGEPGILEMRVFQGDTAEPGYSVIGAGIGIKGDAIGQLKPMTDSDITREYQRAHSSLREAKKVETNDGSVKRAIIDLEKRIEHFKIYAERFGKSDLLIEPQEEQRPDSPFDELDKLKL